MPGSEYKKSRRVKELTPDQQIFIQNFTYTYFLQFEDVLISEFEHHTKTKDLLLPENEKELDAAIRLANLEFRKRLTSNEIKQTFV